MGRTSLLVAMGGLRGCASWGVGAAGRAVASHRRQLLRDPGQRAFSEGGGGRGWQPVRERKVEPFKPKRVLVVTKTTRFEDEAQRTSKKPFSELSEKEQEVIRNVLTRQGFNVSAIVDSHQSQLESIAKIQQIFERRGVEVELATSGERFTSTYTDEKERSGGLGVQPMFDSNDGLQQAMLSSGLGNDFDLCVSAGGDGTFLRAALSITGRLPILGINTDPQRSRGRLCAENADGLENLLDRLEEGKFEWVKRQRIQLTLRMMGTRAEKRGRTLRQLALNEVYIGEKDPCRAAVLKVSTDDKQTWEKHKCSGLLVSTGTGATAWMAEATTLTPQDVMDVVAGIDEVYGRVSQDIGDILQTTGFDAGAVAAAANKKLLESRLQHDDPRMQLLVREPILSVGDISDGNCVWHGTSAKDAELLEYLVKDHHPSRRSVIKKMTVASVSNPVGMEAQLVLDGRVWVALERGMEATLECNPEHALWSFRI